MGRACRRFYRGWGGVFRIGVTCVVMLAWGAVARADAVANWIGGYGTWSDPTQWSTNPNYPNNGTPSGVDYDAVIADAGMGVPVVMLSSPVTVNSVTVASADAWLEVNSTLTAGSVDIEQGSFDINATVNNAQIIQSSGVIYENGGTLNGVGLGSDVSIYLNSTATVANGINLNGHTLTETGPDGLLLDLNGSSYTLSNGTVKMTSPGSSVSSDTATGSALTVGTSATIEGMGLIGYLYPAVAQAAPVTNRGVLLANAGSGTASMYVEGNGVINDGTMEANGGSLYVEAGSLDNSNGTIEVEPLSSAYIFAPMSTPMLGTIVNNGGTVALENKINNAGQNFTFGGGSGTWELFGAEVDNGTVSLPPTTLIESGTFSNVSLGTDLTVNGGLLQIENGFNPNGHNITIGGGVNFLLNGSSYSLNGVAVTLNGENAGLGYDGVTGSQLTIGSTTTVKGEGLVGGINSGPLGGSSTVSNNGLIQAQGGSLSVDAVNLVNNGTIEATKGSTMIVGGGIDNSNGTFECDSGGTFDIEGSVNPQTLGTLSTTSGSSVYLLEATVNNSGQTLTFGTGVPGTFVLENVDINGGTLSMPNVYIYGASNLTGVTLGTDLSVYSATIRNGINFAGHKIFCGGVDAAIGWNSTGAFTASGVNIVLGGSVQGLPPGGGAVDGGSTGTFTFDATCEIQGYGVIDGGNLENNGTFAANVGGQMLTVQPDFFFGNSGTMEASGGGVLQFYLNTNMGADWTDNGPLAVDAASKVIFENGLAFGTGSAYDVTLGASGTSGILQVEGNLNISGAEALNITALAGAMVSGTYEIASYGGKLTGTFGDVTPGYEVIYSTPGEILVVAVPEPAALAMIGACAAALGRRRARAA